MINSTPQTDLYFEAHITIDPVFDEDLKHLKDIAERNHFKVADLLMQKRLQDTPERSKFDTFMTSRSKSYKEIEFNTRCLVNILDKNPTYKVRRFKIENTLLDVRRINGSDSSS